MFPETRRQALDSEEKLIAEIKKKHGLSFTELLDFAGRRGIQFGPQRGIFDVINEYAQSGLLQLNIEGDKVIYVEQEE